MRTDDFAEWDVTAGDGLDEENEMIEARFKLQERTEKAGGYLEFRFSPVYANNDESHPNYRFWKATPSGELKMNINANETDADFVVGAEYRLLFEELVAEPA